MPQIIWLGQSGCLLPLLIIFNLFFGRLFFHSTVVWLSIEGLLILIFMLQAHFFVRKMSRQFGRYGHGSASDSRSRDQNGRGRVIDVEGKVVEDRKKLK